MWCHSSGGIDDPAMIIKSISEREISTLSLADAHGIEFRERTIAI